MTLTPQNISYGSKEQIGATFLHSASIWVKIHMAHWLPRTQASKDQILAIRMDDVNKHGVGRIQTSPRVLTLKQRRSGIQSCKRKTDVIQTT
jgi:hypothetical protein